MKALFDPFRTSYSVIVQMQHGLAIRREGCRVGFLLVPLSAMARV